MAGNSTTGGGAATKCISAILLLSSTMKACGISSSPSNAAFVVSPAAVSTDHDCAASRFLLLGGSSPSTDHSKRCTSTEALSGVRSNPRAKRQVSNVVGRMSSVTTTGGDGGSVGVASDTAAGEGGEDKKKRRDATKSVLLGVFGEDDRSTGVSETDDVLACPSTLGELSEGFRSYGGVGPGALSVSYKTSAKRPGVRYVKGPVYTDFVEDMKPSWTLSRTEAVKEGTFQSPVVSWLYERGWRQGFNANGFPGIDEEFRQVEGFFLSTGSMGGTVVDLSCGSGLMTRRLVASKNYSRVIGGDLSSTMLAETAKRFKDAGLGKPELIRCDVSRLPFQTKSLDGVHAGAALHCWSKLEESLSEVFRVLKPGKGFFATTFLTSATINTSSQAAGFKFFELDELERLMTEAGFDSVKVSKNGRACAIIRAIKGVDI